MATITAVTTSIQGEYLDVLDPATWVGGVVPGAGDIARFPNSPSTFYNNTYTNTATSYAYIAPILKPWQGTDYTPNWDTSVTQSVRFAVASTSTLNLDDVHQSTSGSFITTLAPEYDWINPVTLNYESKTTTLFNSCSIDSSSVEWVDSGNSFTYWDNKATGRFRYQGTRILRNQFCYQLTGNWTVGKIEMGQGTRFKLTGSAYLTLADSTGPEIDFRTRNAAYSVLEVFDESTIEISGSSDISSAQVGIDAYRTGQMNILISGSANYSSSLVSASAQSGDSVIHVVESSSFEDGDIISIQAPTTYKHTHQSNNVKFTYPTRFQWQPDSGSEAWLQGNSIPREPETMLEDEVVRVANVSGSAVTVKKFHTRYGYVCEDLGTYDYNTFVESYDNKPEFYAGNLKAISVNSTHKKYAKGQTIVINNKAYEIKAVSSYLSQSQFIDYTNAGGDTPQDTLVWSEYAYSGSGWSTQPTSPPYITSTYYYWDEIYRKGTIWGSGSVQGDGGSFHINTSSLYTFSPGYASTKRDAYASLTHLISGSYWDEGEIEVSASIADTLYNDSGKTYNARSLVAIDWPYHHTYEMSAGGNMSSRETATNTQEPFTPTTYGFSGFYGPHINAPDDRATGVRIPINNYTSGSWDYIDNFDSVRASYDALSGSFTTDVYAPSSSFSIKWKREGTKNEFYHRDSNQETKYFENFFESGPAGVGINIHNFAKIFSVSIKQRCQILLLDTTDSFSYNDEICDGGLLYDHNTSDECKWLATEVEDAMSYKNLLLDWYETKGKTNIHPYVQGFTYNSTNYGNNTNNFYYTNGYFYSAAPVLSKAGPFAIGSIPLWANAAAEITFDLGAEVTFDTIGINFGSGYQGEGTYSSNTSFVGNYMQSIGIDVGTSTDTSTYTTFRAVADDTRQNTGLSGTRFYTTGSAVTARIIRVKVHRGSKSTLLNRIRGFGVYNNHNDQKIKLKNVNNFKVGDKVFFYSKSSHVRTWAGVLSNPSGYQRLYPAGMTDRNNTLGGLSQTYEITAIDTSARTITLDRAPVYQPIEKGTLCYKANRGGVHLKVNDRAKQYGGFNLYRNYGAQSKLVIKNALIDGWNWSSTTNQWVFDHVEDCVIDPPNSVGLIDTAKGIVYKNVFNLGGYTANNNNTVHPAHLRSYYNTILATQYTQTHTFNRNYGGLQANFVHEVNSSSGTIIPSGWAITTTSVVRAGNELPIIRNTEIQGYRNGVTSLFWSVNQFPIASSALRKWENIYDHTVLRNWNVGIGYRTGNKSMTNEYIKNKVTYSNAMQKNEQRVDGSYGILFTNTAAFDLDITAGVVMQNHPSFAYKDVIIQSQRSYAIGLPYIITKESGYFKLYRGFNMSSSAVAQAEGAKLKTCMFVANRDCDVTISFNMDYRWSLSQLLGNTKTYGATTSGKIIPNISFAYIQNTETPYFAIYERDSINDSGIVLDSERLDSNSRDFTNYTYNKTITLTKDRYYEVSLLWPNYDQDYYNITDVGDYKNCTFNVFCSDLGDVDIQQATFDSEKLFNNPDNDLFGGIGGSRNMGPLQVKRITNDTGSFVRVNNVKF